MLNIQNMKIAAYTPDNSACGYYRVIIPLAYLHKYNICKQVKIFGKVELDMYDDYDIILAQRETLPTMLEDLHELQSRGKFVILDTDDLLESVHPSNPAYGIYHPGGPRLTRYLETIRMADGVTTSTVELRDNYKYFNKNIHVSPNYIDFDFRPWPQYQVIPKENIRLGWAGSSSHQLDLMIIGNVLKKILDKYSNVQYAHFGDDNLYNFMLEQYGLPEAQMLKISPIGFDKYPAYLTNFDIGLCPIADTKFNQAKSYLKPLEYSACGVPFVASAVTPYMRFTEPGENGFLASTEEEWIEHLSLMIEDKTLRNKMSLQAYEKAKLYDWKNHIPEYIETLNNVINNNPQTNLSEEMSYNIRIGRNEICRCGSGLKAKKCKCNKFYC